MSPARTSPGPVASRYILPGRSDSGRSRIALKLRRSSMVSSLTPAMVENSCTTSSTRMEVMAAPGSEPSSTRRSELPSVMPNPADSGSATMRAWVSDSSSTLMCGRSGSMMANPAGAGLSKLVTFIGGSLSRVELDNDCWVKLGSYLRDVRLGDHPAGHGGGIHSQPNRNFLALQVSLHDLHELSAPALGRPADLITYLYRTR